jgi:hypothetical protein
MFGVRAMIYLDIKKEQMKAIERDLKNFKNGVPKALTRSINTALTDVKNEMISLARTDYNYNVAQLRKRITITRAKYTDLSGKVKSKGGKYHLYDIVGKRKTTKGYRVNVKKSTGMQFIPHAFSKKIGKKYMLLIRKSSGDGLVSQYPVRTLYASHPEIIYNTPENWNKLSKKGQDRLDKALKKEVNAIVKGWA